MKVKWRHVVEYAVLRATSGLLMALPHRAALAMAWGPARLAWALNARLRARTLRRMRQALGTDVPIGDLRRMGWLAFRHLAFTVVEGMRLPGIRKAWVDRHMKLDAMDEIRTLHKQGRGFIVAVPHMGNWELAGIALHAQGVELVTLFRRQRNPLMNAWINRIRVSTGVETVDTRTRAIGVVAGKLRDEHKVLALLPDVRAKVGGVRVCFLGVETEVPGGTAHYAREAGVPVYTAEVVRTGWMQHSWRKTGRIESDPALSGAEDRQRIMQYVMDRLGESIRAHPENYFWFNPRWVLGKEKPA
jgi:Kdo2-lipid IVA lauroyltransferase/acyltransferase